MADLGARLSSSTRQRQEGIQVSLPAAATAGNPEWSIAAMAPTAPEPVSWKWQPPTPEGGSERRSLLDSGVPNPVLLALVLAWISLPVVALTLNVAVVHGNDRFDRVTQVPLLDAGRLTGVAGAVTASALIAGAIGPRFVRKSALGGFLATTTVAWIVAIGALPVLPVVFGYNYAGSLGFATGQDQLSGHWFSAVSTGSILDGVGSALFFPLGPFAAPISFALLCVGVAFWTYCVRRWDGIASKIPPEIPAQYLAWPPPQARPLRQSLTAPRHSYTGMSDLLAQVLDPLLLALFLAVLSWPLVALFLPVADFGTVRAFGEAPPQVPLMDPGRWEGAFGAVVAAGIVGGLVGAPLVRYKGILGILVTMAVSWMIAIAALPVLPVLLDGNDGGNLGFAPFQLIVGEGYLPAVTATSTTSGVAPGLLGCFGGPAYAPGPFLLLLVGVVFWARQVRKWTSASESKSGVPAIGAITAAGYGPEKPPANQGGIEPSTDPQHRSEVSQLTDGNA